MSMPMSPKTKSMLTMAGALVCLLAAWALVGFFAGRWKVGPEKNVAGPALSIRETPAPSPLPVAAVSEDWVVYLTGAVIQPGVYSVPQGSRFHDVIRKAGGLAITADAEAINLAEPVADGAHLHVPKRSERPTPAIAGEAVTVTGRVRLGDAVRDEQKRAELAAPVNVNTATAAELETLPGIGPKTAADIVADREKNGRFLSVDDLTRVKGIGPKKLEALRGLVTY